MAGRPDVVDPLREVADHVNRTVLGVGDRARLRVSRQANSIIAFVDPTDEPEAAYVIKMRAPDRTAGRRVEWAEALCYEFESLRRLNAVLVGVRVPSPLHVDADRLAIAMTRLPGRALARRYRVRGRLGAPFDRPLRRDLERTGAALRALHLARVSGVSASPESILSRLLRNIDHPSLGASARRRALLERASAELAEALSDPSRWVLCHHDFTLHNVLVEEGREIGIVDLDGVARNRPEADLSTLWLSLSEWLSILPGEALRRRRLERLWSSFETGYGDPGQGRGLPPFLVWRLVNRIVHLASEVGRRRGPRELHRRRLVAAHRAQLARVLEST